MTTTIIPSTLSSGSPLSMTRLELCRRVQREAGLGPGNMTTTIDQSGENRMVVEWVDTAWSDLQSGRNWDWLWEVVTVTISSGSNITAGDVPATRYCYDTCLDGTRELVYIPWQRFRVMFPTDLLASGSPWAWSVRPDKAFVVNAEPTSSLALSVERYMNPTVMDADDDVPIIPPEHQMAIVWRAVMYYAGHDEASALYQHARAEYMKIRNAMGYRQLPSVGYGVEW